MTPPIPESAEGLTPAWLSVVLGAEVSAVSATRIGENESFSGGALYRLEMAERAPIIAKLSPSGPAMRTTFAAANLREVSFYTRFAKDLPVPACLHAASDEETGATVLLLEDMATARAVSFLEGLWPRDAQTVLDSLAQLHARWWNAPELSALSGGEVIAEFPLEAAWAAYPDAVAELMPNVRLPQSLLDLGTAAVERQQPVYAAMMDRGPLTVIHRDPQLDNILFDADGRARLLDWQFMGRGRCVWDVAYFLISSLPPVRRRKHERALVEHYHAKLTALGVSDYALEDCWQDYIRAVLGKLFVTVSATVTMDNSSAHKRAWRRVDLDRLLGFIKDHDLTPAIWDFADD